jgi:hypothetical protein
VRRLTLLAAMVVVMSACGGGGDEADDPVELEPNPEAELSLTLRHTEPLRAVAPVTWTLEARNAGQEAVLLTFGSGQRGEVVLAQGPTESYRWSKGKAFTQVLGETSIAPGESETVELKDTLSVTPGQYDLVASLKSLPSPVEVRRTVTVSP